MRWGMKPGKQQKINKKYNDKNDQKSRPKILSILMDPSQSQHKFLPANDLKNAATDPGHQIYLQQTDHNKNKTEFWQEW